MLEQMNDIFSETVEKMGDILLRQTRRITIAIRGDAPRLYFI